MSKGKKVKNFISHQETEKECYRKCIGRMCRKEAIIATPNVIDYIYCIFYVWIITWSPAGQR